MAAALRIRIDSLNIITASSRIRFRSRDQSLCRFFRSIAIARDASTSPWTKKHPPLCNVISIGMAHLSNNSSNNNNNSMVDLRSDTVTAPSRAMLEAALTARTGDDVMGEDPTVMELQDYVADLFGKDAGLFVPTGTMSNLVGIMAHCHGRASEMILGSNSHISLWEGGNVATIGGVHPRQLPEHEETGELSLTQIQDAFRHDRDDHFAKTAVVCLENTHNMMGGVAMSKEYTDRVAHLIREWGSGGGNSTSSSSSEEEYTHRVALHLDGARIFNAATALKIPVRDLCENADSVSVCLSKGLGAPVGSVLVGSRETMRLAKRARKRCGGGMRQAGVIAAMGLYAIQNNVAGLVEDERRAKYLAKAISSQGFRLPRGGKVDTNMFYFRLPEDSRVPKEDFCLRLSAEYGVQITGGYSRGGEFFRVVTHLDVDDEGIERAAEAMVDLCRKG